MAKLTKMPSDAAAGLTVRQRMLLFCIASGTDPYHAGIANETVKSHLSRLFEKTGARRQADLVKLAGGFSTPLIG